MCVRPLFFILCISGHVLSTFGYLCLVHDKCLADLRTFTQSDEFHIYTSTEEAEAACSAAKDAYLCVTSAPECRDPSEKLRFSPILRGSSRLLNEFCGFRSKRRPCCALRTAYLEHSKCYVEVNDRLKDCNDRYRMSLELILGIEELGEQNAQRYCSMKWFGTCVKKATQNYCGKAAAQIMRSYAMKAGQYRKVFVQKNELCQDMLFGDEKINDKFCEHKRFDKCFTYYLYLKGDQLENESTDEDKFKSICSVIHDTFECLGRAFEKCLVNKQAQKFDKLREGDEEIGKNNVCMANEITPGSVGCLDSHLPKLEQCKSDFDNPAKYTSQTMPFHYYYEYFCASIVKLERCIILTAGSNCGYAGRKMMVDIIQKAAVNLRRKCISTETS